MAWLVPVAAFLLLLSACTTKVVTPPPPTWPSEVVTQAGTAFYVRNLRLPGTFQDLRLKQGDSITWLPFDQVEAVLFTGPVQGVYRPAQIYLGGGGQVRGMLFVDVLIEGTTDQGYWNIPMSQVERLNMGTE